MPDFKRRSVLAAGISTAFSTVRGRAEEPPAASSAQGRSRIRSQSFGATPDGQPVDMFSIKNRHNTEMRVITYGAIITHLMISDRNGRFDDVVLGYDALDGYLDPETPYFGAVIGRYANRIAEGRFTLDGAVYELARNNGPNHLHGGVKGFDKVVWRAEPFEEADKAGVRFSYTSPDGEEGYPGELVAEVNYTLTDQNELVFDYRATTTKATPANLTQHTYFNLNGAGKRNILDHLLALDADAFTPVDSTLIPAGGIATVAGTPFDFRSATRIGERIGAEHEQLRFGLGYDHNFVLNGSARNALALAARVQDETTGRVMEVFTTEPGIQFYSGNFLDGTITGKEGHVYGHRYGFCLETQHFPDSPNQPSFPSTILRPGNEYKSQSVYRFGLQRA